MSTSVRPTGLKPGWRRCTRGIIDKVLFPRILQLHPRAEEIWVKAATWEAQRGNFNNARRIPTSLSLISSDVPAISPNQQAKQAPLGAVLPLRAAVHQRGGGASPPAGPLGTPLFSLSRSRFATGFSATTKKSLFPTSSPTKRPLPPPRRSPTRSFFAKPRKKPPKRPNRILATWTK